MDCSVPATIVPTRVGVNRELEAAAAEPVAIVPTRVGVNRHTAFVATVW